MLSRVALSTLLGLALVSNVAVSQEKDKPAPSETEAWIQVLAKHITDGNKTIKDSAHEALAAVGEPALPFLKKAATGSGPEAAEAKKIIERIEQRGRRGVAGRRGEGAGGQGEGRPGAGGRLGAGRRDPFEGMELDADVKSKVEKIRAANGEARRELMQKSRSGDMDREEAQEAMQALTEKMNKELKGVLSEEQFKKYEENSARRPGGGRRGGRGGGGGGGN